jgi:ABC-type uncharacterized transport system substrate-binding protein
VNFLWVANFNLKFGLAGKNDLNFAIATPAAQALLNADGETPSVFTAVTDPVEAGLVESLDAPGGSMTGSTDATDVEGQIDMLLKGTSKNTSRASRASNLSLIYSLFLVNFCL